MRRLTDRDVLVALLGTILLWLAVLTERMRTLEREAVRVQDNAVVIP